MRIMKESIDGKIMQIMKHKNIFLLIVSALFIFGACTEETIIDGPDTPRKGSLTLELDATSALTKAESYATKEELAINNGMVLVFEDAQIIREVSFGNEKMSSQSKYKVRINNLDYGTTYKFVVVANPANVFLYNSLGSLEVFENIVEGDNDSNGFAAYSKAFSDVTKLVKVGDKTVTFNAANAKELIQIPLTQLAARVKVNLKYSLEKPLTGLTAIVSNIRTNALVAEPMNEDFKGVVKHGMMQSDAMNLSKNQDGTLIFYTYGTKKSLEVKLAGKISDKSYSSSFNITVPTEGDKEGGMKGCFENGHYYEITASIKSIPLTGQLVVEIEKFIDKSVSFTFD